MGFRSSRVRDYQKYEAHLPFYVSVENEETDGEVGRQPVTLTGYTHRVGNEALSLVGPYYRFGYRYLMGRDRTLQIELRLPTGTISIQGLPIGYVKLSDEEIGDGYMLTGPHLASFGETDVNCLIEVGIVVISDSDRGQLTQYLRQLNYSAAENVTPPAMLETPQPQDRSSYGVLTSERVCELSSL